MLFAAGTLDADETRIEPRADLLVGKEKVTGLQALETGEREVVAPFLLLALIAVVLEGFAFHRRW
jgi:hypothetical protein